MGTSTDSTCHQRWGTTGYAQWRRAITLQNKCKCNPLRLLRKICNSIATKLPVKMLVITNLNMFILIYEKKAYL